LAKESVANLLKSISDGKIMQGLAEVGDLLDTDKPFEALKKVRMLLPLETTNAQQPQELSKEVA
jgi:flagellar protein FlbT